MTSGLQVYNTAGGLVFDSSQNTLVTLIKNSRREFTKVNSVTYKVALSDLRSPTMKDYYIRVWDSTNTWYVNSTFINDAGELVVRISYSSPNPTIMLNVKVYRC